MRCSSGERSANSPMSAPATKARSPAPVITATRTSSRASSASNASSSSRRTVAFNAFRFSGRLIVTHATASTMSTISVS